jgi:uncharacterized protein YndB with AHSA1/START domain
MTDSHSLKIVRMLPAHCARVFAAWTDPRLMARWFYASHTWTARVSNELRVGGAYQVEMLDAAQVVFRAHGHYRQITPVTCVEFTWNSDVVKDTLVNVSLRALGDSTELTLTHSLFDVAAQTGPHTEGWEGCLGNLHKWIVQVATA